MPRSTPDHLSRLAAARRELGTRLRVGVGPEPHQEEADSAVAEVVRIDDDGFVLLRVLPGTVEDNRSLLRPLSSRR